MPDPNEPLEEEVVETPEASDPANETPEENSDLVIDLDEPAEGEEDADSNESGDLEDKQLKPKNNGHKFAQDRILKKVIKRLDGIEQSIKTPLPHNNPVVPPVAAATDPNNPRGWSKEQWDAYAKKDWRAAVDLRSKIQTEDILTTHNRNQSEATILNKSKSVVSEKHPELLDTNSEKTRIYLQVLDENPRYLTDPKGPIHAMRDMEDKMRDMGYADKDIYDAEKRGEKRANEKHSRVAISSARGKINAPTGNKVVLTKTEVEFCKFNNIDVKEYARNKVKLAGNKKGEVQV